MWRPISLAVSVFVVAGLAAGAVYADPPRVLRSELQDRGDRDQGRSDGARRGDWDGDHRRGSDASQGQHRDRDGQQVAVRDNQWNERGRDGDRNRIRDRGHEGDRNRDRDGRDGHDGRRDDGHHDDGRHGDRDRYGDNYRDQHRNHDRGRYRDRDRYRVGVYLGSPWTWDTYGNGYGRDYGGGYGRGYGRGYGDREYRDDCRVVYRWRYNRWGRRYSEPVQVCYDSWGRSYVSPYSDRW